MYKLVEIESKYYDSINDYRNSMLEAKSSFDGCFMLENYEDIEKWHLYNKLFEKVDTCPPGYSIGIIYLYIHNNEVIGMVNIRPDANNNPMLSQFGGHIGYSVKPSYRKMGVGKNMLKDALLLCKEKFCLDKVLITCFKDNEGSKKIIVDNGGVLENEVIYPPDNKLLQRYWISLR